MFFWWVLAVLVVLALCVVLGWKPLQRRLQQRAVERGIEAFRIQREQLEARFFDIARARGKPRGLRWLKCDWQPAVTFARDTESGLLTAFVAVIIRFEAVEGGDMEDVEAVGLERDAAAVFHFNRGTWGTGGRALFNMNPADAVDRLAGQFVPVARSKAETTVRQT